MSSEANAVAPESAEAPQPTTSVKKPSRRGKGSRQKAAEKFRKHKNETIGAKYISDRIANFHLSAGYSADMIFGPLSIPTSIQKPDLEVAVSTSAAAEVAEVTVRTLVNACKVPSHDIEVDIETVSLALSLQIMAKIHYACQNSPFAHVNAADEALCQRVIRHLNVAPLPIAVFLDQIGVVEVQGQRFFPNTGHVYAIAEERDLKSYSYADFRDHPQEIQGRQRMRFLQQGLRTLEGEPFVGESIALPHNGPHGGQMHVVLLDRARALELQYINAQGVLEPQLYQAVLPDPEVIALQELVPAVRLPPPDVIFARYSHFIARVQRKLPTNLLPQVNLESGKGSASQLVANGDYDNGLLTVWTSREIQPSDFFMSGAFRLGEYTTQPLYSPDVMLSTCTVDTRQAIFRLAETLTKKVDR